MTMPPVLQVLNVSKRYPWRPEHPAAWVIRDLTFSIYEGEFLTIVGPSGAGKTTLLNLLAQIDVASGGEVRFRSDNQPLGDADALQPGLSCRIGYVTQDDHLLPWRTALDNVLLPLQLQKRLTDQSRRHAHVLMEAAGLFGFEKYYPHELSGGMRKRVSLVRTLVYDPPVILMDEPFSSVDAQTRTMLQEDLLSLAALRRTTIIFVTHDITEAIALGDRTLVLTRAPARVRSEHHITIPRPRDIRAMLTCPEFSRLYRAIRQEIE